MILNGGHSEQQLKAKLIHRKGGAKRSKSLVYLNGSRMKERINL